MKRLLLILALPLLVGCGIKAPPKLDCRILGCGGGQICAPHYDESSNVQTWRCEPECPRKHHETPDESWDEYVCADDYACTFWSRRSRRTRCA